MMIPIETLVKLFKRSNLPVALLHLVNLIFNITTLLTIYAAIAMLDQGNYPKEMASSSAKLRDLLGQLPRTYNFNTLVNIAFNAVIMVLAFINQRRLRKSQRLSEMPYLLGITLSAINFITELINGFSPFNTFMQFIYLSFYLSARNAARLINMVHDKLDPNS